ncbi:MAG: hypothetical protein IAF38_04695 [Bacteroidia bacterium]|nr:hypothetical protein [Bacteroidia bacterium]
MEAVDQHEIKETRGKRIFGGIGSLLMASFFFLCALGSHDLNDITESDLTGLEGILLQNPKIVEIGKGNSPALVIKLREYPGIRFENLGIDYENTYVKEVMKKLVEGDTVILKVLKHDYETKLAKIKSRNFMERLSDPSDLISMYGLIKGDENFVDFKSLQSDLSVHVPFGRFFGWITIIVLFVLGIAALFFKRTKIKKAI